MEYVIDHRKYDGTYSREQVQALINEKKIEPNIKIWNAEWREWRLLKNTDFDLSSISHAPVSSLPENIFLSATSYLDYIDRGHIFRKPFSWLYALFAIINLISPIYTLYYAFENNIFDAPSEYVIVFLLIWLIIAFASWISFQIWWDRKSKVISTSQEGDEFVATPVFSHIIQTIGEWLGTWIGIVGFSIALLTTLILGDEGNNLSDIIGLGFMKTGFIFIILMPIYGFLIIITTRFLAEQFRALSTIANNTRKN